MLKMFLFIFLAFVAHVSCGFSSLQEYNIALWKSIRNRADYHSNDGKSLINDLNQLRQRGWPSKPLSDFAGLNAPNLLKTMVFLYDSSREFALEQQISNKSNMSTSEGDVWEKGLEMLFNSLLHDLNPRQLRNPENEALLNALISVYKARKRFWESFKPYLIAKLKPDDLFQMRCDNFFSSENFQSYPYYVKEFLMFDPVMIALNPNITKISIVGDDVKSTMGSLLQMFEMGVNFDRNLLLLNQNDFNLTASQVVEIIKKDIEVQRKFLQAIKRLIPDSPKIATEHVKLCRLYDRLFSSNSAKKEIGIFSSLTLLFVFSSLISF